MRLISSARLAPIIALIMGMYMEGGAERLCAAREKNATDDEPYVQVTSVTIEPSTIHRNVKPDRATIIVQIMLRGEAPPDSTARVDIGTYSADPTGNMVSYGEQSQTFPLKEKNIVVKFAAEANSQTSQGKIIVAATIHKTTKGVNIKQPESYKDWRAELVTMVP
jgi:hypothetical protein